MRSNCRVWSSFTDLPTMSFTALRSISTLKTDPVAAFFQTKSLIGTVSISHATYCDATRLVWALIRFRSSRGTVSLTRSRSSITSVSCPPPDGAALASTLLPSAGAPSSLSLSLRAITGFFSTLARNAARLSRTCCSAPAAACAAATAGTGGAERALAWASSRLSRRARWSSESLSLAGSARLTSSRRLFASGTGEAFIAAAGLRRSTKARLEDDALLGGAPGAAAAGPNAR
mmetsp:Transcript_16407/g.40531  ORF Transcript_16407/g.40531 Transcript_16407/m.40531 type:complete len:232 (-) Transcript_16407:1307-2002(-)